jgi:ribonuclease HII
MLNIVRHILTHFLFVMGKLKFWSKNYVEAGCDEVGRGCLCGPVVAAAVVLPRNFEANLITDSKLLKPKIRLQLDDYIKENALDFAITELSAEFIDQHNILNASIHAMHLSLDKLKVRPELILIDGNRFHPYNFIPHQCIVKGDSKILSIAAASILAKNYRDKLMIELHDEFPQYGWNKNMGYATKDHREALMKYGPTVHHRKSFKLIYDK